MRNLMTAIRTPRLRLRDHTTADADVVAELAGDWRVARMLADLPLPFDQRAARTWLVKRRGEVRLAIEYEGTLIGGTSLCHYPGREAELGYWLGKAHWGKGFAREAASALLVHGFSNLRFSRLRSGHFIDNPASGRVLRSLGFVAVGRGHVRSLARGGEVETIHYELPRALAGYPPLSTGWTPWLKWASRGAPSINPHAHTKDNA